MREIQAERKKKMQEKAGFYVADMGAKVVPKRIDDVPFSDPRVGANSERGHLPGSVGFLFFRSNPSGFCEAKKCRSLTQPTSNDPSAEALSGSPSVFDSKLHTVDEHVALLE